MRIARAALLGVVLLATAAAGSAPVPAEESAGGWPFGTVGGGRGLGRMGRKDLWNLGILGAKARDPDRAAPQLTAGPGGRVSGRSEGPKPGDPGPARLAIELLYPGGPAAKAGLRVGDIVVGVGRGVFKEGSLRPLADALTKAESGKKKGLLTLLVERAGVKGRIKLPVTLPVLGKSAAKPTEGAARQGLVTAALDWLAKRQLPSGGYPQTSSGTNGAVVQTSLAGLAWLAGGSDLEKGAHSENLQRALGFVGENLGVTLSIPGMGGAVPESMRQRGLDQTNWGYAYAAIFLGELRGRSAKPKVKRLLHACGAALAERQEPSGGWAHGPGGPNPLGYTELNIVSGLALCGLGMARRAGWEVPPDVLAKAEAYLKKSSGGDGGVGYSAQPGQAGQGNIGRTAACWLGYVTLGLEKSGWGQKMRKYAQRTTGAVQRGHASLMQHICLAGVVAHALGAKSRKLYWDVLKRDLVLARAPDGSFQPRPWHESQSMGSNTDVTMGEVWTTASWALVLASEPAPGVRPGLLTWTGRK